MLADIGDAGADVLLCLGDVVGYGADPGPVVDMIAERAVAAVAGNHDFATTGRADLAWFNLHARRAAEWTAEQLGADHARYLAGLPLVAEHAGATMVHASPVDPAGWPYLLDADDGYAAFRGFPTGLCFVGHSHLPAVWTLGPDGALAFRRGAGRIALDPAARHIVNVGSVGQPRDGDPAAAYALWEPDGGALEIRRVPYDAEEARRRIHAAGLPRVLGDRLLAGR